MGLRKSSGFLEFKQLQLHDFEQFHEMIEKGTIVCPNPLTWQHFYKVFIKRADPEGKLKPMILTSWAWSTDEEKNNIFKEQLESVRQRYETLDRRPVNWQKRIFDYFDSLEAEQSKLVVV